MYAIIDKSTRFIAMKKEYSFFVKSYKFGEMGYEVKLTKFKHEAKKYKTFTGAAKAAHELYRTIGDDYDVANIEE